MGRPRGVDVVLGAAFAALVLGWESRGSAAEPAQNELPDFEPRPKSTIRSIAIRTDLVNPLLDGQARIGVEGRLTRELSVEVVPELGIWRGVFTQAPVPFGEIVREAHGLGPLAGGEVNLGLWPGRRPFQKTVYRFGYAARWFRYRSSFSGTTLGELDQVQHLLLIGGGYHWLRGALSLALDGFVGVQVNPAREIAVVRTITSDGFTTTYEVGGQRVGGSLHPLYVVGGFLIGVAF